MKLRLISRLSKVGSRPVISVEVDDGFYHLVTRHRLERVVYVFEIVARRNHRLERESIPARRQKIDGLQPVTRFRGSDGH
jgi:hypothetical protein